MVRRRYRYLLVTLGIFLFLLIGVPVLLYIPAVQQWAVEQITTYLNDDPDATYEYHVGLVRIDFPVQLRLEDIQARQRSDSSIVLSLDRLQTGLAHVPWGKQNFFSLSDFQLTGLTLDLDTLTSSFGIRATIPSLRLSGVSLDASDQHLLVQSIDLEQPNIAIYLGPSQPDSVSEPLGWQFDVDAITINEGRLLYHNSDSSLVDALAEGPRIPYFDHSRFLLDSLNVEAQGFCFNDSILCVDVHNASTHDLYSKANIRQLQAYFELDNAVTLRDLTLTTSTSHLEGDLDLNWHTMRGHTSLVGELSSDDLLRFVKPYYPDWSDQWPVATSHFLVKANVDDDDIQVDTLSVQLPDYAYLDGHAMLLSLRDDAHTQMSGSLHGDILRPDSLLSVLALPLSERSFRIPDSCALNAQLDYREGNAVFDGYLTVGEDCRIDFDAQYAPRTERYHADIHTTNLDAPLFVEDIPWEGAHFSLTADGRGFTFPSKQAETHIRLQLDSIRYIREDGRRDLFSEIQGSADLRNGEYVIDLHSDYPILQFTSQLTGRFLPKEVSADGYFRITHADMQHLPAGLDIDYGVFTGNTRLSVFYDWDRVIDFSLDVDSMTYVELQEVPLDSLDRPILRHLERIEGNHIHHDFDPIAIRLRARPDTICMRAHSGDFHIDADFKTDFDKLSDITPHLTREIDRMINETSIDLNAINNVLPEMAITANIGEKNPLLPLLRAYGYSITAADVSFHNEAFLSTDIKLCDLRLPSKERYDTIQFRLQPSRSHTYFYDGRLVQRSLRPSDSYCLTAEGQILRDSLTTRLIYADASYQPIFDQRVSIATEADVVTLRLLSDPILFARTFNVNPDTYLELVHFTSNESSWEVNGRLSFDLDSIPVIRADFSYTDSLLATLHLDRLPLDIVNIYTLPTLEMGGTATADFSISASIDDIQKSLKFDGGISMTDGRCSLPEYGIRIQLPTDELSMGRNRLLFRNYPLTADGGGLLTLRGMIDFSKDLANPTFGLTLLSDHAYLMRKSRRRNNQQLLAGTLPVTTDISINGLLSNLQVKGNLNILEGTDLTYWMTDDPLQTGSKVDELVTFKSFREIDNQIRQATSDHSIVIKTEQKEQEGLNVELTLNIDRASRMNVSLSPIDDSRVAFIGGGQLKMKMPPNADLTLSGTYDISEGTVDYKLPMLPVSKHFELRHGSYVQWDGKSATNPVVHLIAGQDIRTSVSSEASGTRLVTFSVDANIEGTLSSLGVTFDCKAPDDGAIATELRALTDEDRQKQALMLLIAQTYIGPSASNSAGLSTASAALNSLLAREIDGITSGLKHTKVDLGIDTYGEGGQNHTDLSVKVSQSFFDDRIRVSVGGKVSTGSSDVQQDQSAATLGDVSLDWMIRKDGSKYLELFRHTNFENILEGQVVEMGAGYAQERTAYRFLDLFLPSMSRRERRLQELLDNAHRNDSIDQTLANDTIRPTLTNDSIRPKLTNDK